MGGSGYRYKKAFIEEVPVPLVTLANQLFVTRIEILVDFRIDNDETKITNIEIEQQIDQLVYQLYDLTDEEIAIVEKASN